MKKLLLLMSVFITAQSFSQVFWEPRSTAFANVRGVLKISIADENNVWLEAYDGTTPANQIFEYAKSTDAGETWTNATINIPGLVGGTSSTTSICSLKAISGSTCFLGIADNVPNLALTGLYKTTDGGSTWVKKTNGIFVGSTSFFDFGAFFTDQVGVAVGDPLDGYMEIYRTTDGGDTWTRIPSSSIAPIIPASATVTGEYAFTNSYEVNGNTCWFLTNKARTFRSVDAGLTWQVFNNENPATDNTPGGQTCFKNGLEGIMYNAESMFSTTDGGETWTEYLPEGTVRSAEITFVPGSENTYVSIGLQWGNSNNLTNRGTSISYDGGLFWESINDLGDTVNVNGTSAVQFYNENVGYASGFSTTSTSGGIFKYVAPLANETFSNDKAFTASPNPTSGLVTIAGKGISNVVITDVLGKQVANTNFTSVESATIDMSSYNAGVYLVKVTNANGNASTIKVVRQ